MLVATHPYSFLQADNVIERPPTNYHYDSMSPQRLQFHYNFNKTSFPHSDVTFPMKPSLTYLLSLSPSFFYLDLCVCFQYSEHRACFVVVCLFPPDSMISGICLLKVPQL